MRAQCSHTHACRAEECGMVNSTRNAHTDTRMYIRFIIVADVTRSCRCMPIDHRAPRKAGGKRTKQKKRGKTGRIVGKGRRFIRVCLAHTQSGREDACWLWPVRAKPVHYRFIFLPSSLDFFGLGSFCLLAKKNSVAMLSSIPNYFFSSFGGEATTPARAVPAVGHPVPPFPATPRSSPSKPIVIWGVQHQPQRGPLCPG